MRQSQSPVSITAKAALLNVRSLRNKTCVLQYFIASWNLDFFIFNQDLLDPANTCFLAELLPVNYSVLNTPQSTGTGGGVATLFKDKFKCSLLPVENYLSFELQLVKLELSCIIDCAVIYRPPKYDKDFIQDFSYFVSSIVPIMDNLLILGNFNIHVCCSSNLMGMQFFDLIESFNLTQSFYDATHSLDHTLDLVLSMGLSNRNVATEDNVISVHRPVFFFFLSCDFPFSLCNSQPEEFFFFFDL